MKKGLLKERRSNNLCKESCSRGVSPPVSLPRHRCFDQKKYTVFLFRFRALPRFFSLVSPRFCQSRCLAARTETASSLGFPGGKKIARPGPLLRALLFFFFCSSSLFPAFYVRMLKSVFASAIARALSPFTILLFASLFRVLCRVVNLLNSLLSARSAVALHLPKSGVSSDRRCLVRVSIFVLPRLLLISSPSAVSSLCLGFLFPLSSPRLPLSPRVIGLHVALVSLSPHFCLLHPPVSCLPPFIFVPSRLLLLSVSLSRCPPLCLALLGLLRSSSCHPHSPLEAGCTLPRPLCQVLSGPPTLFPAACTALGTFPSRPLAVTRRCVLEVLCMPSSLFPLSVVFSFKRLLLRKMRNFG